MKRIAESGGIDLAPAKLYIEDLRELFEIIARENPSGLYIRAGNMELTTIDELDQLESKLFRTRLPSFEIGATSPRVGLEYGFMTTRLTYDADSTQARGIAGRLKDHWKKCERRIVPFTGGLSLIVLYLLAWWLGKTQTPLVGLLFLTLSGAMVIGMLEGGLSRLRTTLLLRYRAKQESFWKRHQDRIWQSVFAAVVGGAVALAYKHFFP